MSLYEVMDEAWDAPVASAHGTWVMHDPCKSRNLPEMQDAARSLLVKAGYTVSEPVNTRGETRCCGQGGLVGYTDASMLVGEGFDFKDGLFSGYDAQKRSYDKSKWALQTDANGVPKRDLTLQDKRCVFQLLKTHYDRYNLGLVSKITGTPEKDLV